MRIWNVQFERGQRGWNCTIVFTLATTRQFTDEQQVIQKGARFWPWAYVRARREARKYHRLHGAKCGERVALGWTD